MRRLGILLALVLALAAAACGGSEPAAEQAPQDAIVLAAAKTDDAGSYKVDMTSSSEIAGQAVELSGSGEFDGESKRGQMAITTSVAGQELDMEIVFAFPLAYVRLPPELGLLSAGKTWAKLDLEKLGHQEGFDIGRLMQAGTSDPSQGLDFLRGVSDVQVVGEEEARGVATTHYTGVVDLQKLGADDPDLKAELDKFLDQSGKVPVEVWIDEEGFVRRLKQTVESNGSGFQTSSTVTTDFYDYGTDVNVEEPPADEVADFSELMGQG
jgi:LppX_LprAFG lipoprotein